MSGFIALYREAFAHPVLKDAERFRAWFWLVAHAAWKPTRQDVRGHTITVERGQICAGREYLAKQWGWSPSAVERFLTRLETEQMIGRQTGQMKTIITICNYEKYQSIEAEPEHMSGQPTGQKPDRNRTTKEQGNKGTREEDSNPDGLLVQNEFALEPDETLPKPELTPEHVVATWNKLADKLGKPKVRFLTPERRQKLKARIAGFTVDDFRLVIRNIDQSPFLRGDLEWKGCNFDWVTKKANFIKILEGNYEQ